MGRITYGQRLSIILFKYIPPFGAFLMLIQTVCLMHNLDVLFAEWIFGMSLIPCVISIVWSLAFKFCYIHRLFLYYIFIVSICIKYNSFIGFIHLFCARLIVIIIGIVVFSLFIIHFNKYNNECFKCYKKAID